ncbi:uncharacterized protein LOC132648568 isoform X1 [Meriones unguiculatus]|uniref:uncharacterized protein LOC132648568 isoform X1 n=1 Tax=Meriones unguiculatus TaxID=10047 RepID=UPI00293F0213|nr:uncharacterized protein LOC132648568 isoform X1 [Meriones unguiculatus]XP_060226563.1 uncharacterized protein LOC132648568 isoform X1 [Meriones unguiculatus]
MRVWLFLTFTTKQKKTRRTPLPAARTPTRTSTPIPGLAQARGVRQSCGHALWRLRAPEPGCYLLQGPAPRNSGPGGLARSPCPGQSRQLPPGLRNVAGLKFVLSRAGILAMLWGYIWLASGRQEGSNLFRVILHKILPHNKGYREVEAQGMRRELLAPSPGRLRHVHSWSAAGEASEFLVLKTPLCLWKLLPWLRTINATLSGSFQLDCRHLVAGSGDHVGPSFPKALCSLGSKAYFSFFPQPTMDWNFTIPFSGFRR